MTLVLRNISDRGDAAKERVVIKAAADVDIGKYVLAQTMKVGDQVLSTILRSFWLPDQMIKKGDWVVVYSKRGEQKEKVGDSGGTTYFFYWNAPQSIWAGDDTAAVLMHIDNWQSV